MSKKQTKKVTSSDYTEDYFLSCCQGYDEYESSLGNKLPLRLEIPFALADIKPNSVVLDLGCGRGELIKKNFLLGNNVIGVDYSRNALNLSKGLLQSIETKNNKNYFSLICANAFDLPFKRDTFDIVFLLDVIEHLYHSETNKALSLIFQILKPNGKLIIHTMPNLNYYKWGYPIFRLVQKLRGVTLPTNPRDRWQDYSHVHVNEQTPKKMSYYLKNNGFKYEIILKNLVNYDHEKNLFIRNTMKFLSNTFPFKLIFCNDILAIATKE